MVSCCHIQDSFLKWSLLEMPTTLNFCNDHHCGEARTIRNTRYSHSFNGNHCWQPIAMHMQFVLYKMRTRKTLRTYTFKFRVTTEVVWNKIRSPICLNCEALQSYHPMSPPARAKKYTFDATKSVSQVGSISTEAMIPSGGPIEHANVQKERAAQAEKERYDRSGRKLKNKDLSLRRREQNRKSSKSVSEGQRTFSRVVQEMNVAIVVQDHSLRRTNDRLDEQIEDCKRELGSGRSSRRRK